MKWIIIIGLLLGIAGLILVRYRRQMLLGWNIAKWFFAFRKSTGAINRGRFDEKLPEAKLVRCVNCDVLIREDRAVKPGGENFYCSQICVRKFAANQP